jgi:hypothetical protein
MKYADAGTTRADSFFLDSSVVPRWSFDVQFVFILSPNNLLAGYVPGVSSDLESLLNGQNHKIRAWHVKSVKLPPWVDGKIEKTEFGNAFAALPTYEFKPESMQLTVTLVEDAAGHVANFLTLMRMHVMDFSTGVYRSVASAAPINIYVRMANGLGTKTDKIETREYIMFEFCSLINVESVSYEYDSDSIVEYTATFQARSYSKQSGFVNEEEIFAPHGFLAGTGTDISDEKANG